LNLYSDICSLEEYKTEKILSTLHNNVDHWRNWYYMVNEIKERLGSEFKTVLMHVNNSKTRFKNSTMIELADIYLKNCFIEYLKISNSKYDIM